MGKRPAAGLKELAKDQTIGMMKKIENTIETARKASFVVLSARRLGATVEGTGVIARPPDVGAGKRTGWN